MKREDFILTNQRVLPGTRATVSIPVSVMPDHSQVDMDVHVIHGRKPGPTVFVSAAIHGDEVIGVEVVRRLMHSAALNALSGTLLLIPIVNHFGFLEQSRYLPDRRDLNRCFPGSDQGSLGARLARIFMQDVVSRCDIGIDIHSAAVSRTNLAQIRFSPEVKELRPLALAFGAPVILYSRHREGSLRLAAHDAGVNVLLFEAGEGLRYDEASARAGHVGILRVLAKLGMIAQRFAPKLKAPSLVCEASHWLRAPMSGLFRVHKNIGDVVQAGDSLGVIANPLADHECDVTCDYSGVIVGRKTLPVVHEGEALFHVARVLDAERAEAQLDHSSDISGWEYLSDEDEIL